MPAPYAIADFANAIPDVLQDDAGKLYPIDGDPQADAVAFVTRLTPFVQRAIERYSKDRPLELVSDVVSDGTQQLPLPVCPDVIAGAATPVFEPGVSSVTAIECPLGQQPPQYIDPGDFVLYRAPAGYKLLLTADTPLVGASLRMTWTARHPLDGSTVPDCDFLAVVDFAASLAAERLATAYAQTGDPTVGADVVNYRSKRAEYQAIADKLRKRYFNHLGVDESSTGAAETGPAIATGQIYEDMQSGVGRLVHTKYSRR